MGIQYFTNADALYPSTIQTVAVYTLRKQIILDVEAQIYWRAYRMLGLIGYSKFPNTFYGIGNQTSVDDAEDFTDEGIIIDLNYQREILPNLFLGPAYNYQTHALVKTDPDGILRTGILPGTDKAFATSGLGVALDFDTRNHVNFPGSGTFLRVQWLYCTKSIGSDFNFIRYDIDLRRYFTVLSNDVLAFQGTWTHVTNRAPLLLYPVLGDDRLRGFAARYWDLNLLTLQTEYRKTIWGRIGLAVFAGVGDVADRLNSLELRTIKFGVGFGLRYMVLPEAKFNLRVDVGFGNFDNSSLSFLAGEAF